MRTTGPILTMGAVVVLNESVVNGQPVDWRVPVATGMAAAGFALLERLDQVVAVDLAWLALITTCFVRIKPGVPAPVESILNWWNAGKGGTTT